MTHASGRAGFAEQMAAIAIAIIGHDPRHRHAEAGEPGERAPQEGNRALLVLVGQDLGVGEARGIVDTDMQVIPADAAMAVDGAGAAAGDAMTDALDSAELLGVDVQQLAWVLALISNDHGRRIEGFQAVEAEPPQHSRHRRDRHGELPSDRRGTHPLAAQSLDLGNAIRRRAALVDGRRAPVIEAPLAARPPTLQPFSNGLDADAELGGDTLPRLFLFDHAAHHEESTTRRRPRILVDVHPGLRLGLLTVGNHQFPKSVPDEQPS